MNPNTHMSGIHHITAISPSAVENLAFYERTLGLRLVKQTVNFDDPYTYHLYYGDARGAPGTILTFFHWENLPRGRPGAGMVTAIAFAIPRSSLDFWRQRLSAAGCDIEAEERFGDRVLRFTDPHGLPLELIGLSAPPETNYWHAGPIAAAHAVTGFHSATATLHRLPEGRALLVDLMGMSLSDRENNRYRFAMADPEAPGHFLDLVIDPQAPTGQQGGGTVHHIAFRTESDPAQLYWQSRLREAGVGVTDVRDRKYFHSIYFHAPQRVLFEIATDPPGFTVDEAEEGLGGRLRLPAQYERMRPDLERHLPPLRPPPFEHLFKAAPGMAEDDGRTIVTLHGTGGNEHDLLGIAGQAFPASAILSPRGKVLENGLPRYFKRLADNVFDESDVIRRAHELADFLAEAVRRYGRDPSMLTAFGYSNGANMASAVMLLRPEIFSGAVLLRPMLPLQDPVLPDLRGKKILILRGRHDAVIPSASTGRLAEIFTRAGAEVTAATIAAGHEITPFDLSAVAEWMPTAQIRDRRGAYKTLTEEIA